MSGRVVHFEIPADNVKRAQAFYSKAFGWQMNELPGMNYTMVGTTPSDQNGRPKEPGAINGGMGKRKSPLKNPVVTIGVDSVDESLETVKKLGGKVVKGKEAVADMGFIAYIKDTEGNIIGLWQPARM
jgi:predicted enzyme related to lactoylglutathione lyase